MAGRAAQDEGLSTDEITVMIGGRDPRDDRWPAVAASRIEAAAAALELCETAEFESVLMSSLAEVAAIFGAAALGECTGVPGEGVTWFDEASTSLDELVAMIDDLEASASVADGPYSIVGPSGRPAIGVPNPPGSFAHYFAVLASDPVGFTAEQTSLLSLFASTVSSARRRVDATRLLEARLANQEFLNDISALAAGDTDGTDDTLREIAVAARAQYEVAAVTMWRFEDLHAHLAVSSSDDDLDSIGVLAVPVTADQVEQLRHDGWGTASVGDFSGSQPFRHSPSADLLVVPMMGAHGAEGAVVFTASADGSWSQLEVAGAQSIARSMQKVLDRRRAADAVASSVDGERVLRSIAGLAGGANHAAEPAVLAQALDELVGYLGLDRAILWEQAGDGSHVEVASAGGAHGPGPRPPSDADLAGFTLSGYAAVNGSSGAELLVALNEQRAADAVLQFVAEPGRVWSDSEINAARTASSMLGQARARFTAERRVHRQLELEGLARRIAGWAVEARTDTVDDVLQRVVVELAGFFALTEAQIWRISDGQMELRRAYRPDGQEVDEQIVVPFDPGDTMERRGWVVTELDDVIGLWGGEAMDPPDSRLLITSYGDAEQQLGLVILVDPSRRHWDDDELTAIRSVADTIAQLRTRLEAARALEWQHVGQQILNRTATDFVNATLESEVGVLGPALQRMRDHLDCHSVAVFALNHDSLEIECPAEATVDGEPLQALYAPMKRDDPMIARILDPTADHVWTFGDLIGVDDAPGRANILLFPSVRGRDIVIVSAVQRFGATFRPGTESVLEALTSLVAQFRSRMRLERNALLRSEADRMLGEVAADFVERSVEDANAGVYLALGRFATLFGLETAVLWRGDDLKSLRAQTFFQSPSAGERRPEAPRSDAKFLLELEDDPHQVVTFTPGADAPDPAVAQHTVMFAPIVDDGVVVGALSSTDVRPLHLVPDLDTQRDFMQAAAHLIRQLWRRLEADAEIGRKLASEDLLRQFATRLVTSERDVEGREALGWLARRFGLDHASMWRVDVDGRQIGAELRIAWNLDPSRPVPDPGERLEFEAAEGWSAGQLGPGMDWPMDLDRPGISDLRRLFDLDVPRRGGFVGERDGAQLFFTRPGEDPIPEHVISTMATALSILSRHAEKSVAERAFVSAFDEAPIAVCMRDASTNLISCNAAYQVLTGRSEAEMIGTPLSMVLSVEQHDELGVDASAGELAAEGHREMAYRRPDGSIVWARVRTTSVEVPGRTGTVFFTYSEDITESRRARQLLEYQATHDELTGLPNRRAFVGAVSEELTFGRDCAVLILDLDRFKLVNDSLGHSAGDMLLITCADRIRLSVRPGDTVCRLGGDEFAILLRSPADNGAAIAVADRLLRLLSEPVRIGEQEVFPSASIGIAIPDEDDAVEDLLRHADAAMYQAKAQGRDCSVRFDRSMRDAVVERIQTETELRRAIENDQLEVHYQPEFVLDSGQIVGAEALLRWRHPQRGLLTAGAFIGLVEETGLVVDIGRWVLGEATMQAAKWVRDGHDLIIRVNLSARQLRGAVVGEVQQALAAAALAPERLCLELTETAIMDDVQESARILQEFRDLGVQVAIDDFGTGFSSLAYLKRFPVDILKIDRTFVDGVGVDPDDTAIVRSVIGLARTLRLEVVAEGIEDPTQIAELVRLGCNRGQGFHLARPAPAGEIAMLLAGSLE